MVNEHLDVESHWLRDASFVSDGNTTEIEGEQKEAIDTEEAGEGR